MESNIFSPNLSSVLCDLKSEHFPLMCPQILCVFHLRSPPWLVGPFTGLRNELLIIPGPHWVSSGLLPTQVGMVTHRGWDRSFSPVLLYWGGVRGTLFFFFSREWIGLALGTACLNFVNWTCMCMSAYKYMCDCGFLCFSQRAWTRIMGKLWPLWQLPHWLLGQHSPLPISCLWCHGKRPCSLPLLFCTIA